MSLFHVLLSLQIMICLFPRPSMAEWNPDWRKAVPGWNYEFPRDHGQHPDFKTEWWYFTGNLISNSGQRFGYEFVIFRQGVRLPASEITQGSAFAVDSIKLAHFALSVPGQDRFYFDQKSSRGAFGDAGFESAGNEQSKVAWIGEWSCVWDEPGKKFLIRADAENFGIDLELTPEKAPVIHGKNGASQKSAGAGNASHYYSFTRMTSHGTVHLENEKFKVTGESWFDHEWASNQLATNQTGWDWFSIQFDDNTELMIYQLRLDNGGIDPFSHGTYVDADGKTFELHADGYLLKPMKFWKSKESVASYPIKWKISVTEPAIELVVTTPIASQELVLNPITYWEGMIVVQGQKSGNPVSGRGYLEMTGYGSGLPGLSE